MTQAFFIGDLHLGHTNISKHRPQFESLQQMRDTLCENWHKTVTKRDTIYLMGDAAFDKAALEDLSTWAGEKVLILGNHDSDRLKMEDIYKHYKNVRSLYKYHEFWLSHCPVHPDELRGKINIHGHVHDKTIMLNGDVDSRYINVSCEAVNYTPISLGTIRQQLQEKLK